MKAARFHETLKEETASPPRSSIRAQQSAFEVFQQSYNEERPHEALGMKPPAEVYELSPRSMPAELVEHSYGEGFEARSVRQDGSMKWGGKFAREHVVAAMRRHRRRDSTCVEEI